MKDEQIRDIQTDIDGLQEMADKLFHLSSSKLKTLNGYFVIELNKAITEILYQKFRLEKYLELFK